MESRYTLDVIYGMNMFILPKTLEFDNCVYALRDRSKRERITYKRVDVVDGYGSRDGRAAGPSM